MNLLKTVKSVDFIFMKIISNANFKFVFDCLSFSDIQNTLLQHKQYFKNHNNLWGEG